MFEQVRGYLTRHQLPPAGVNILAACSGGPDSLVLVHILHRLHQAGFWHGGLAVAHVNHQLRPEAAAEGDFVADFCRDRGLTCYRTAVDVTAHLVRYRCSLQEGARQLRYEYLFRIAAAWNGALVATGHHRDDQAETVLMQLFRGAGLEGLKGMRPLQGGVLRPLLGVGRREIEEYCRREGWQPCMDPSNHKTDYLRNRIRLELLPALERDYNPRLRETLDRTAVIIGDAQDYLVQEAVAFVQRECKEYHDEGILLPEPAFRKLHIALQREVLRQLIEKKRGSLTGISFAHVEKTIGMLLDGQVGSQMILPGGFLLWRDYGGIIAGGAAPIPKEPVAGLSGSLLLTVPGDTVLTSLNLVVNAQVLTQFPENLLPGVGLFDGDRLELPLTVRTWQDGDRFNPRGMVGSKKLQDYFVDAKIPRGERERIPLICDQSEIIWIAGRRQARRGEVDEKSRHLLQLTLYKLQND